MTPQRDDLHRRLLPRKSRPGRLGRSADVRRDREGRSGAARRDHQQPHGADRRDRGPAGLKRPCRVELHTDSQYVRNGITQWLSLWKARGWRTMSKGAVKNEDLWRSAWTTPACATRSTGDGLRAIPATPRTSAPTSWRGVGMDGGGDGAQIPRLSVASDRRWSGPDVLHLLDLLFFLLVGPCRFRRRACVRLLVGGGVRRRPRRGRSRLLMKESRFLAASGPGGARRRRPRPRLRRSRQDARSATARTVLARLRRWPSVRAPASPSSACGRRGRPG